MQKLFKFIPMKTLLFAFLFFIHKGLININI